MCIRDRDKGATVLLFSVPQAGAEYGLPLFEVYQKELTVKGSFINPDTHQKAVNLKMCIRDRATM